MDGNALVHCVVFVCNGFMLARATVYRKHSGNNNTDTESNETFRVVVGGYLIKAGIENARKIVTSKQTPQEETDDNAEG